MVRRHHRFALRDVTFAGVQIPGATLDCWEDEGGQAQWSARIVGRFVALPDSGQLVGHRTDGGVVSGPALVAPLTGPLGRRTETLLELHGSGNLEGRPTY